MSNRFPRVGVIGAGQIARMIVAPAIDLGINLLLFAREPEESGAQVANHVIGDHENLPQVRDFAEKCDIVTLLEKSIPLSVVKGLENAGVRVYPSSSTITDADNKLNRFASTEKYDCEIAVIVARSPHGQATSWAPAQIFRENETLHRTVTPAQDLSTALAEEAQKIALEVAQEINCVGVMVIEFKIYRENLFISAINFGPQDSGAWSIDASFTSQFEQHLRAILDLPLGSPSMVCQVAVTGMVIAGEKTDMYRPYLHLMARNPTLSFHQYKNDVLPGTVVAHITACGDQLPFLLQEVQHAQDYMSGVIDE